MSTNEVLFPPGATARDWAQDALLATILSVTSMATVTFYGPVLTRSGIVLLAFLSLAMTAPLILRRHSPLITLGLCTLGGLLQLATLNAPTISLAAVPVVAYSVARWVPGTPARWVIPIGAIGAFLGPLSWFNVAYPSGVTAYILYWGACMGAVLTPYAVGRRFRELTEAREQQAQAAEDRYQLQLAERERQTQLAEASTRAVIARELHDIVAHSLSVMIVQAEGARAASERRPEVAQQALTTIADTGRDALAEMRRIVGVLRSGPDAPAFAPAPRLDDLSDLVLRTSDRATFEVVGQPYPVPPALEVTLYRVVQEALTNFLKHAGPDARAHVTLTYETNGLVADVVDDGVGVTGADDGAGNGLRGMYERVSSMGGTLRAGPQPEAAGFRVTARVPLRQGTGQRPASPAAAPADGAVAFPPPSGVPGVPPAPPTPYVPPPRFGRLSPTTSTQPPVGGSR